MIRACTTLLLFALFAASTACKRDEPSAAPADAGTDAAPAPSAFEPTQVDSPHLEDRALPAMEAAYKKITRLEDDPLLSQHRDAIVGHFKENLPTPLLAQIETLPAGRRAILIPGPPEAEKPLIFVVLADGTRAWTKDMPLAGIVPGVREMAIVRGRDSSVGLAFCDASGKLAALRTWHADGGINADYEVLDVHRCESISALYWPGHGHLVAASGEDEARIGLIDESGGRTWPPEGLALRWRPPAKTAVTIAVDTDDTFVLIGIGITTEAETPEIFAMRYDKSGKELWPLPISVARPSANPPKRIEARVIATGKIDIEIDGRKHVELTSEGNVVLLPPRR